MLTVKQFLYSEDNLGYLVHGNREALVIDGGACDEILSYINTKNLEMKYIANTHSHYDHTNGNRFFLKHTKAVFIGYKELVKSGKIGLDDTEVGILDTPGHSSDSVCFYFQDNLISGDTLFIARIGHCSSNMMELYFQSIQKLLALPDSTVVYPGHDYTDYSIRKAREIEPYNNLVIDEFLAQFNPHRIASTLAWEKLINPFLHFNDLRLQAVWEAKGFQVKTGFPLFKTVRENF